MNSTLFTPKRKTHSKHNQYDPDDDGNSWQSVYRNMRCPLPGADDA